MLAGLEVMEMMYVVVRIEGNVVLVWLVEASPCERSASFYSHGLSPMRRDDSTAHSGFSRQSHMKFARFMVGCGVANRVTCSPRG